MHVQHIAIQTINYESALEFYNKILGLKIIKPTSEYKNRKLCFLDGGSIEIELYSNKVGEPCEEHDPKRGGLHHLAFDVNDLNFEIDRLSKAGIKIVKPPFNPISEKDKIKPIAFILGPDGQEIELRQK